MRRLAFDPARPKPRRRSPTWRPGRHHHDPNLETDSTNDEPEHELRARLPRRASIPRGSVGSAVDPRRPRHIRPRDRALHPRHPVSLHSRADAGAAPVGARQFRGSVAIRIGIRVRVRVTGRVGVAGSIRIGFGLCVRVRFADALVADLAPRSGKRVRPRCVLPIYRSPLSVEDALARRSWHRIADMLTIRGFDKALATFDRLIGGEAVDGEARGARRARGLDHFGLRSESRVIPRAARP